MSKTSTFTVNEYIIVGKRIEGSFSTIYKKGYFKK